MNKAAHFFGDMLNSLPLRVVSLDYPVKGDAEAAGMNLAEYKKLMFEGINTDYEAISQCGTKLQGFLRSAKQIRVTTPAGTDITFAMAPGRGVYLDDGIVTDEEAKSKTFTERAERSLPGGSGLFCRTKRRQTAKSSFREQSAAINRSTKQRSS